MRKHMWLALHRWLSLIAISLWCGMPVHAQTAAQGSIIQDCQNCPPVVVLPAGSFLMGAAAGEDVAVTIGSGAIEQGVAQILQPVSPATPQHRVIIGKAFAMGQREITFSEYAAFVADSKYQSDGRDCLLYEVSSDDNIFQQDKFIGAQGVRNTNWRTPPAWNTGANYPVTCISWGDAQAYVSWLSKKTGKKYRLPTEAEWEYAARAGTGGYWYWGNDAAQACIHENVADQTFLKRRMRTATATNHFPCDDQAGYNRPVAAYKANPWGLHDMVGNVSELVEDCWHADYQRAPTNGSAWISSGDCRFRVLRGSNGMFHIASSHVSARSGVPAGQYRAQIGGFRVVREL